MFNKNRFKACIVEAGKSIAEVAECLDISESTMYRKIERNGDFKREEIDKLIIILNIKNPMDIFFESKLA